MKRWLCVLFGHWWIVEDILDGVTHSKCFVCHRHQWETPIFSPDDFSVAGYKIVELANSTDTGQSKSR